MDRGAPGEGLPASHDHIDISRADLEAIADATGHFGRDQAGARPEKRIIDPLTRPAVVDDRTAHALDRLLRGASPTLRSRSGSPTPARGQFIVGRAIGLFLLLAPALQS